MAKIKAHSNTVGRIKTFLKGSLTIHEKNGVSIIQITLWGHGENKWMTSVKQGSNVGSFIFLCVT